MKRKHILGIMICLLMLMIPYEVMAVTKADVKAKLFLGETTHYSISNPEWINTVTYSFEPDKDAVYVFSASGAESAGIEIYKILSSGNLEDWGAGSKQLEIAMFKGHSYIIYVNWYCDEDEIDGPIDTALSVTTRETRIEDSGICGEDMTWELDELGNLSIAGTGTMAEQAYNQWGDVYGRIRTVTIFEGVEDISAEAFCSEGELISVELPSTLKTIGSCAFEYCGKLRKIVIPDGVTCIRSYAFDGCRELSEVTMSNAIVKIGSKAFYDTALKSVSLPESIEFIGKKAFGYSYMDGSVKKDNSFVVTGYEGSAAENYGKSAKLTFESCGSVSIEQPELVSVSEKNEYIKFAFKTVPYATQYNIYKKVGDGEWRMQETVSFEAEAKYDADVEENWVQPGTKIAYLDYMLYIDSGDICYYSVQAVNGTIKSSYDETGLALRYVECPGIMAENESSYIKLQTYIDYGVEKYTIYRKAYDGEWESWKTHSVSLERGDVKEVKLKDRDIAAGKKYSYKIKIMYKSAEGESCTKTSAVTKITRLEKPSLSVTIGSSQVSIKWNKVKGAVGYFVYRGYMLREEITDKDVTNYVDKNVKNGMESEYFVYAYGADGSSSCDSTRKDVVFLSKPSWKSASNASKRAVLLKWKENKKSDGIQIQYSTDKSMKNNLKTVNIKGNKTLSKKISKLSKGKTYYFRIRFYGLNMYEKKCYSTWSAKKSVKIVK